MAGELAVDRGAQHALGSVVDRLGHILAEAVFLEIVDRDDQGRLHAPDVKTGDRVIFGKWSGSEIKIDGADFLVMKESDIIGVLE